MPKLTDPLPKPPWQAGTLKPRRTPTLLAASALVALALLYALASLSPCAVGPRPCYKGYSSRYSFDADRSRRPRWMTALPDAADLSALSIPGTHDTMTYGMPGDDRLQCQIWDLGAQLAAGLRYFDIRARLRDDGLWIYHAGGFTGYGYADVLGAMVAFLDENPGEAVVMRLKEEGPPLGHNNTISFEDALRKHHKSSPGAAEHLYHYNQTEPLPTLGSLRSRIFLLQNFRSAEQETRPYGPKWEGPQMVLEDLWIIPDVPHLEDKWDAIRGALELAANAPLDNSVLYLAHVSASVGVLPIEAAAGPLGGGGGGDGEEEERVEGMNDRTGAWLDDFDGHRGSAGRVGIVILDFPGKELIDAVLRWNEPLMDS